MITKRKELIPIWSSRPNNSLFSLHRQLSDLFGDVFEGFEPTASLSEKLGGFYPKTNVVDTPQALEISLEVPGIDPKSIEISLTKDAIAFRGEKKQESNTEEGSVKMMERSWGQFTRTIPLDFAHDTDKVDAVFDKGILRVTIPKLKTSIDETKKVSIRTV